MTNDAALADRRRIGKRMGGCRGGHVAADTRGRIRLYRIDVSLRIQHSFRPPEVVWRSSTWHLAQFLVSPGAPCGLIGGNRTCVKSLMLPLRPITV